MLNCDNGTYDAWYWAHPPAYMPVNCNLEDVAHIKKLVDIPVVCAGRMYPEDGAAAIAGRQASTPWAWPGSSSPTPPGSPSCMEEREEDIKPCICCHNACFTMARYEGFRQ